MERRTEILVGIVNLLDNQEVNFDSDNYEGNKEFITFDHFIHGKRCIILSVYYTNNMLKFRCDYDTLAENQEDRYITIIPSDNVPTNTLDEVFKVLKDKLGFTLERLTSYDGLQMWDKISLVTDRDVIHYEFLCLDRTSPNYMFLLCPSRDKMRRVFITELKKGYFYKGYDGKFLYTKRAELAEAYAKDAREFINQI